MPAPCSDLSRVAVVVDIIPYSCIISPNLATIVLLIDIVLPCSDFDSVTVVV